MQDGNKGYVIQAFREMMRSIAIVTGATGGIGERFVKKICLMDDIDEVWAVGRNKDKLGSLSAQDPKVVPIEADLAHDGVAVIEGLLSGKKPDIRILVNNAGTGYMGPFEKMEKGSVTDLCKINCSVPAELISLSLSYMHEGARIINISSASSFQPNPYLAMYSASKVYLKNFSRALNVELRSRKITVTAVCPGWVDTGMLPRTKDGKEIRYTGMIDPETVVDKALKDSAKGKDMSVPGFFAKYFRFYSKVTPSNIVMSQWTNSIRKYL